MKHFNKASKNSILGELRFVTHTKHNAFTAGITRGHFRKIRHLSNLAMRKKYRQASEVGYELHQLPSIWRGGKLIEKDKSKGDSKAAAKSKAA